MNLSVLSAQLSGFPPLDRVRCIPPLLVTVSVLLHLYAHSISVGRNEVISQPGYLRVGDGRIVMIYLGASYGVASGLTKIDGEGCNRYSA